MNVERKYTIIVVGDSCVGKSSLIKRACDNVFYQTHTATTGIDSKIKNVFIGNKKVQLEIWDSVGQKPFQYPTQIPDGVILVYDITNASTFSNLGTIWADEIKNLVGDSRPFSIVVGNKRDMEEKRAVNKEMGQRFASENSTHFVECSCKTGENLDATMHLMAEKLLHGVKNDESEEANPTPTEPTNVGVEFSTRNDVLNVVHRPASISPDNGNRNCKCCTIL